MRVNKYLKKLAARLLTSKQVANSLQYKLLG